MHAQQLPHAGHAPPIPMMPHPGLPGPPVTAAASLLGLAGAAGSSSHPLAMLGSKPNDMHRGADSDKPSSAIGKSTQRICLLIIIFIFVFFICTPFFFVYLKRTYIIYTLHRKPFLSCALVYFNAVVLKLWSVAPWGGSVILINNII